MAPRMKPGSRKDEDGASSKVKKWHTPQDKGGQPKRVKREKQESKPCRRSARLREKPIATSVSQQHFIPNRKRKQQSCDDQTPHRRKKPRIKRPPIEETKPDKGTWTATDAINHWSKNKSWPKRYFEAEPLQTDTMSHLRARPKPESPLRRKSSIPSLASSTTSDQKSRDGKSAKYKSPSYETVLATKKSFMAESELEVTDLSKDWCQKLLYEEQVTPEDTLFKDDCFRKACQKLQGKNESRIVQDIARLIVPSAEELATRGAKNLEKLAESVNERWRSSIAFCGPLPQPDYAVGFARSAFSDTQLEKLAPFIGEVPDSCNSYFLGTFYVHFPFLTSEVKCGVAALDIADRQNAHSMTLAVRAVAELFKFVGRQEEINQEILAFSISHDHRSVRIYGHYAVIEGDRILFYRHPIHTFDFTALDGKEKWTAYQFTRNIYDIWMPIHLRRICSVIDEIPIGVDLAESQSHPGSQSNAQSFTEGDSEVTRASLVASVEPTKRTTSTRKRPRMRE